MLSERSLVSTQSSLPPISTLRYDMASAFNPILCRPNPKTSGACTSPPHQIHHPAFHPRPFPTPPNPAVAALQNSLPPPAPPHFPSAVSAFPPNRHPLGSSPGLAHPAFGFHGLPYWNMPAVSPQIQHMLAASDGGVVAQYLNGCDPLARAALLELSRMGHYPLGKKLFGCPQCRYITDRKNNLKRHVSTMHQDCDKVLECCGVVFKNKASLRDHVLIFHSNGYMCRYCGRNFCRKALLKRHLTVHSGQKDFVCDQCDYATSHKSNLERHRKVHERQGTDDLQDDEISLDLEEESSCNTSSPPNNNLHHTDLTFPPLPTSEELIAKSKPFPPLPSFFTHRPAKPFSIDDFLDRKVAADDKALKDSLGSSCLTFPEKQHHKIMNNTLNLFGYGSDASTFARAPTNEIGLPLPVKPDYDALNADITEDEDSIIDLETVDLNVPINVVDV